MKKIIITFLALFAAVSLWSQARLSVTFPDGMVMGDIVYQVKEAYVCAPTIAEANKIMENYIKTYNLKRKVTETQKCCNYIDKNIDQGVIVRYSLESSALD